MKLSSTAEATTRLSPPPLLRVSCTFPYPQLTRWGHELIPRHPPSRLDVFERSYVSPHSSRPNLSRRTLTAHGDPELEQQQETKGWTRTTRVMMYVEPSSRPLCDLTADPGRL